MTPVRVWEYPVLVLTALLTGVWLGLRVVSAHRTGSDGSAGRPRPRAPDCKPPRPWGKMVGDITYIPTRKGWLYLATVIDCHNQGVVRWAMDDNDKTPLVEAAITMAAANHHLDPGAITVGDLGRASAHAPDARVHSKPELGGQLR